jgi:hypothetical protein
MLQFMTNLFKSEATKTSQPLFDTLETRSLLSGSGLELESPTNADAPAIVMAKAQKPVKKLNLKGEYAGELTVSLFPNALPFTINITAQKGATIRGEVQAATFPATKFKGEVTKKGKVQGKYMQDAKNKGSFDAKVNADGSISGTLTVVVNGMKFSGTFTATRAA